MVRKKGIKPSQIIVLAIAVVIYAAMGLIVYFFLKPNSLVNINDKQLGICYDMMADLKRDNPKVQLFEISMKDHKMVAKFKYISQKVSEQEDWLALGNEIRTFITKYLEAHPDHALLTEHWEMELNCPGVIYRNTANGEDTGSRFATAVYEKETDLYTAAGFLRKANSVGAVDYLVVEDPEADLDEKTDLSGVEQIKGLKGITLKVKSAAPALVEALEKLNLTVTQ